MSCNNWLQQQLYFQTVLQQKLVINYFLPVYIRSNTHTF